MGETATLSLVHSQVQSKYMPVSSLETPLHTADSLLDPAIQPKATPVLGSAEGKHAPADSHALGAGQVKPETRQLTSRPEGDTAGQCQTHASQAPWACECDKVSQQLGVQLHILEAETRYSKLLSGVGLTQDFFWSYSYPTWRTLQANMTSAPQGSAFDSMFVWNDFLTKCVPGLPGLDGGGGAFNHLFVWN